MELSNSLVKQFARVTNDNKSRSGEATVYGTIKEVDGGLYAKIDGSEILTPVTAMVTIGDGERATITLKNHAAIVTGNLDDVPAASSQFKGIWEDYQGVNDQLVAINLKVDNNGIRIDKLGTTITGITTFVSAAQSGSTTVIDGGSIKADTLNLTGCITFSDLSSSTQTIINNIEETADEALDAVENLDIPELPPYILKTHIDAAKIESPTISGNEVCAYGAFKAGDSSGTICGYFGSATGMNGSGTTTYGVAMAASSTGSIGSYDRITIDSDGNYVIVTNAGVRMQSGDNNVLVTTSNVTITSGGYRLQIDHNGISYNGDRFYKNGSGLSVSDIVAVFG